LSDSADSTEADNSGCGQNIYKAADGVDTVTTDMAVAEWLSQKRYFDYNTGLPVPGYESEA
jgi:hypothetical protein